MFLFSVFPHVYANHVPAYKNFEISGKFGENIYDLQIRIKITIIDW